MQLNTKNKLLALGGLVLLILSYQLAIKKTLVAQKEYAINTERQVAIANLPNQLLQLSQKEQQLDAQLHHLNLEDTSMQSNLLKFLNRQTEIQKVKIIDFNAPHRIQTEQHLVETYIFDLEGGYVPIVKVLNALENNGGFGAITHLTFEKKKDYRSKRTYLQAQVFLEQTK